MSFSRRSFLKSAVLAGGEATLPRLMGNRFITFNTVVRVNQIEVSRDRSDGEDEGALYTVQAVRAMREAFQKGFPGGRMTSDAVADTLVPVCLRHCLQWQATTFRKGPWTSYVTAPHRQEPLFTA